jgi:hypothetical protein
MTSRPPSTGTLQARPLYRLLIVALERQISGSVVLESADGRKSAVLLRAGRVVKIKTAERVLPLGSLCVQLGFVDDAALQEVLASPRDGLLGETLVERGLMGAAQLKEALEQQLLGQVAYGVTPGPCATRRSPAAAAS